MNIHEGTVYRWARRRELPAFKAASEWLSKRGDIELWIGHQKETNPVEERRR